MLGGCSKKEGIDKTAYRTAYYSAAARRFALDARMFRCRAAVHVENKDDIAFWGAVLKHFRPGDKFHFLAGSRNEFGRETYGVTQCLKYFDYLNPNFFICIDSDYRYLLRERMINVEHYVLQTYTYSFENHHCFAEGLDDVCSRATHMKNTVFDFRRFLKMFSNILYDLFVWHLYFQNADPSLFSQAEFDSYLCLSNSKKRPLITEHGEPVLEEWKIRIEKKVEALGRKYSNADLDIVKERYRELGLTPDNVYLFVRGHNLYDLVLLLCKEVCKLLLRKARKRQNAHSEMMKEVYRGRYSVDYELRQNIKYGAYLPICKIEEDVINLLGKN